MGFINFVYVKNLFYSKKYEYCFRVGNQFSTPVYFCWFRGRDLLRAFGPCDPNSPGWKPNFVLYGGLNQTRNTIAIYHYLNKRRARLSSNLFLRNDINLSHLELRPDTYYIPGKGFPLSLHCKKFL